MKDSLLLKFRYKNVILISLICFLSFASCGINLKKSEQKKETALAFLKYYRSEILKNKSIILLDAPSHYDLHNCMLQITSEKEYTLFDKEDFADKLHSTLWNNNSMDSIKVITKENVPNTMTPDGWSNFRKNFGMGYYVFSQPIVSNDLNYTLFFTAYNCGERCGNNSFDLYKKTKIGWELVKKYCDGIS